MTTHLNNYTINEHQNGIESGDVSLWFDGYLGFDDHFVEVSSPNTNQISVKIIFPSKITFNNSSCNVMVNGFWISSINNNQLQSIVNEIVTEIHREQWI